jgi:hypothetical protein
MRPALFQTISTKLSKESEEKVLRVSAVLRGHDAEAFIRLHEGLGGPGKVSRNDLACRILSHALSSDPTPRRSRIGHEEQAAG